MKGQRQRKREKRQHGRDKIGEKPDIVKETEEARGQRRRRRDRRGQRQMRRDARQKRREKIDGRGERPEADEARGQTEEEERPEEGQDVLSRREERMPSPQQRELGRVSAPQCHIHSHLIQNSFYYSRHTFLTAERRLFVRA